MKCLKLLSATAALFAMTMAANANIIADLGVNPVSAQGDFHSIVGGVNGTGGGAFDDQFLFQLRGPQTVTVASATNSFPGGPRSTDFISNFAVSIFSYGLNNAFGGGDDVRVLGPNLAALGCLNLCQNLFGVATLGAGSYYLDVSGTGGGTSGYGGNLSTRGVPGPIVGAGLPGLIAACGAMLLLARRRRERNGS